MTIKIIEEPDIFLTCEELERLRYAKAFTHYFGPVPLFETWVRSRKREDTETRTA